MIMEYIEHELSHLIQISETPNSNFQFKFQERLGVKTTLRKQKFQEILITSRYSIRKSKVF